MLVPSMVIGKVVRRLKQYALLIVVAHAVVSVAIDFQRREAIRCIVIIVDTIAGSKGQPVHDLEAQIHMSAHHITTTFLLVVQHHTQRIILNGAIGIIIVIAFCIHQFHTRRIIESYPQRIGTTQFQATDSLTDASGSIEVQSQVQPISHLSLDVCFGSISFIRTLFNRSFLLHVVPRHIGLQVIGTFREHQFIVLHQARTEYFIDIVHSRISTIQIIFHIQFIDTIIVHQCFGISLSIHLYGQTSGFGKAQRSIQRDTALSFHTALGGNDDHSIGSTRTIDSCRRSIFQNLHTLNVFRIDALQTGFTHHAVHHIKRFVALIDGIRPTDTDFYRTARNTVAHHIDTGYTTLQGITHLRNRLRLESLAVHHRHSTCHISLAHRTITDDYHFVQRLCVFFQDNVQWTAIPFDI